MNITLEEIQWDNRRDKIYTQVANILKILWYSEKVINLQRASICEWELTTWDFFDAVHSEKKNDISENRGYVIETDKRKIFIWYKNTSIIWYHCINLVLLLESEPTISVFISEIQNIEKIYRKEKWVSITVADDVHKLLNT